MDRSLLRMFQRQVAIQCRCLLRAAQDVDKGLQNRDIDYAFYALQNLLNAGANISKSLWGQGGKLAAERKPLRDSIGIDDTSPLREVTMRNNFEHFDERLDRWWKQSARHNNVDMNIGPKDTMIKGVDDIDMFRQFDPGTADITFWGQEFNTQQLVTEAQRILPKLEAEANKEMMNWLARVQTKRQTKKVNHNVGDRQTGKSQIDDGAPNPSPAIANRGVKKHLAVHENKTFSNVDVELDGNDYQNCTFLNCTLIFRATKGCALNNNKFSGNTHLRFEGAAGSTLNFLKALAQPTSGLSEVVKKSFPDLLLPSQSGLDRR